MATSATRPSLENLRDPSVFIKIPEIILLIVAIPTFFIDNPYGHPAYVSTVLPTCFINSVVFLVTYLLGYTQLKHTPVELVLYSYYAVGIFVSSILLMSSGDPEFITSGVFCLILTFVYICDIYFCYRNLVNRSATNPANQLSPPIITIPMPLQTPGAPHHHQETPHLQYPGRDTVDITSTVSPALHYTNPVYPATMNYPPNPIPEPQYNSHPPSSDVTEGPRP